MNINHLALIAYIMLSLPALAQKKDTHVSGLVVDAVTYKGVKGEAYIVLMTKDSSVVTTTKSFQTTNQGNGDKKVYFEFDLPEQSQNNFILKCSVEGYYTRYASIRLVWKKIGAKITSPVLEMRKRPKEKSLKEAKVTATRIKFYSRGDTLIYNADAFEMQDGSMLDALIEQLPGAELKKDGQIFVNGKKVESLLLNGRDFFKGNNSVLLDNLPSYMVHQITTYQKESDISQMMGKKMDEGSFVMDIKLKKKYAIGWLGNAEFGLGTSDRYLSRLFAMRYTPHSQVTFFGNLNNVNSRRKPDGNGDWGDIDPTGGLTATKRVGMSYSVYDKKDRFNASGNTDLNYSDNNDNWGGLSTELLTGGNVFDSKYSYSKSSNLSLSTNHFLNLRRYGYGKTPINYQVAPEFSYNRSSWQSTYLNGTFSVKPSENYEEVLDSLFSPKWTQTVQNLIKRQGELAKGNSNEVNTSLYLFRWAGIPFTHNGYNVEGNIYYTKSNRENFNHFYYDYYNNGVLQEDHRNRYYNTPSSKFAYDIASKFFWHITDETMLNTQYQFAYNYTNDSQMRYRLDWILEDFPQLGWLPSQADELLEALDEENSYTINHHKRTHNISTDLQWNHSELTPERQTISSWYIQLKPTLKIETNKFGLLGTIRQNISKTYVLPQVNLQITRCTKGNKHEIRINGKISTNTPSMLNLVDRTFANNPLNITIGNPKLKTHTHIKTQFNYASQSWLRAKEQNLYGELGYELSVNALAINYTYNKTNGVTTNYPTNINGNWNTWAIAGFNSPLDKKRRLTLNTSTQAYFYHTINLLSTQAEITPSRNSINTLFFWEDVKLSYRYKKASFGLKGSLQWQHATYEREDFENVNTYSFRYGINTILDLPGQLQLSSDLTIFSRRGFESSDMNRNDLVWNARISKDVCKKKLTIMLDAFDILGNLSNVQNGVDSKHRWAYYYNVIPRYAMLRLVYKLNVQPKKKN